MSEQIVGKNKKAFYEYEILDRFEAGIALLGSEVKALRERKISLKESYARIKGGEAWLENCHIGPYSHGGHASHEPLRPRKLLLHRREINKLIGKTERKGLTLVPLSVYFKNGNVKVEIALAHGKKQFDKRQKLQQDQQKRDVARSLKNYRR